MRKNTGKMFTGIVETVGFVRRISRNKNIHILTVSLKNNFQGIRIGDSIAVNGVCLTVVAPGAGVMSFEVMNKTFRDTTLGSLKSGEAVNIERSLPADGRFEGHFVLGHADAARGIKEINRGAEPFVDIALSEKEKKNVAEKGSIAIDGISLTVAEITSFGIRLFLIPHTLQNTNLKYKKSGDRVNVEFDILGKYDAGRAQAGAKAVSAVTKKLLTETGFI